MGLFRCETKGTYSVVICPEIIDANSIKQLTVLSTSWLDLSAKLYVFDFKAVEALNPAIYRNFVSMNQSFKAKKIALMSINLSRKLLSQIKSDGVESVFSVAAKLEDALIRAGLADTAPIAKPPGSI